MVQIKESSLSGIVSAEEIYKARNELAKNRDRYTIVAQSGGQNNMLCNQADIIIGGGSRGGAKSFSLLLGALPYIYDQGFRGLILRHEKDDLTDIIDTSKDVYSEFGNYVISDSRWNFNNGGFLQFSYHGGTVQDFKIRFQGRQYAYVGVDEITQAVWEKILYIITCNRNASGLRSRFFGTCNPDPDSPIAELIAWWIDQETGFPIKERDGVLRYAFFDGDGPRNILWGNTREEVYLQAKDKIDSLMTPDMKRFGNPQDLFIKSVAFVSASLADNIALMAKDRGYLANLAMQSEEQRQRDLQGNWKYKSSGEDMIKLEDMERFYANAEQTDDGVNYASCDAALDGGDNLVLVHWIGHHIQDIAVCRRDSRKTVEFVSAKLEEWRVRQENFTYDKTGIGNYFGGFFTRAVPFNNREAVSDRFKDIYANIKSQSGSMLVDAILDGNLSINPRLLQRRFSGKGFENVPLEQILLKERKALRADENAADKGFTLIKKSVMKQIVGHSPDFIEAILMRMIFDIKRKKRRFFSINDYGDQDELESNGYSYEEEPDDYIDEETEHFAITEYC